MELSVDVAAVASVRELCIRESGEKLENDAICPSKARLHVVLATATAFTGYHRVVLEIIKRAISQREMIARA